MSSRHSPMSVVRRALLRFRKQSSGSRKGVDCRLLQPFRPPGGRSTRGLQRWLECRSNVNDVCMKRHFCPQWCDSVEDSRRSIRLMHNGFPLSPRWAPGARAAAGQGRALPKRRGRSEDRPPTGSCCQGGKVTKTATVASSSPSVLGEMSPDGRAARSSHRRGESSYGLVRQTSCRFRQEESR